MDSDSESEHADDTRDTGNRGGHLSSGWGAMEAALEDNCVGGGGFVPEIKVALNEADEEDILVVCKCVPCAHSQTLELEGDCCLQPELTLQLICDNTEKDRRDKAAPWLQIGPKASGATASGTG